MASSNPHHLPKIPLHIPAHPLRGPGFPHMNSRGIQRLSPQQAHTVSAGGVDLGRLEVKEERQGWGLPGRASLEPSADPYLLAVTPDCGCAPPVIPPSQPRYTPTPTRVIRSKPGRDTTSASQGRLSCKTPGTQPRHWLGHHTHTLSGIPGRGNGACARGDQNLAAFSPLPPSLLPTDPQVVGDAAFLSQDRKSVV